MFVVRRAQLWAALAVFFVSTGSTQAQDPPSWAVEGTVAPAPTAGPASVEGLVVTVEETGQSAELDATGAFRFELADEAPKTLLVDGPGVAPLSRTFALSEDQPTASLELYVRAGFEIEGLITAADSDAPIEGARVLFEGAGLQTFTDEEGAWSLLLPPGELDVVISAPGFEPAAQLVTFTEDGDRLDASLSPAALYELAVRVLDDEGSALPGAQVALLGATDRDPIEADTSGLALLEGLPAGTYGLQITHPSFQPQRLASVPVRQDGGLAVRLLPLNLQPTVSEVSGCASVAPREGGAWLGLGVLALFWMLRRRR
jgi:MYXO-CTERM domain-containing protein